MVIFLSPRLGPIRLLAVLFVSVIASAGLSAQELIADPSRVSGRQHSESESHGGIGTREVSAEVSAETNELVGEPVDTPGTQRADPEAGGRGEFADPLAPLRVIDPASLPTPPERVVELLREGDVKLITGGKPFSDPDKLPPSIRLAGETRIKFKFRYKSNAKWSIPSRSTPRSTVSIRVQFSSIELIRSHEVWLRQMPPSDGFWQNRVVQHEFDHVQISTDPRIEKYFLDQASKLRTIRVAMRQVSDRNGRVSNEKVQQLIEDRMQESLNRTSDLVLIRYRELDRQTRHGIVPKPDGFRLRLGKVPLPDLDRD